MRLATLDHVILALRFLEGSYKYPIGMQPVHFFATHGLSSALRYFIEGNGDVGGETEDGRKVLHMAIENGHVEATKLLDRGADPNGRTADNRTPLQCAMECGDETITRLLVSKGAAVDISFSHWETPLSLAVNNRWHSSHSFSKKMQILMNN